MNRRTPRRSSRSAPTRSSSTPKRWNIRPSMIAIYVLVFVNSVLIISSAHKLFKKTVEVSIKEPGREEALTVEVQNGCGVSGIAARIGNNLTAKNYRVVGKGNADHFNYEKTTLIDLHGNNKTAVERLRKDLGIAKDLVYQVTENSDADVRLIIGKDHQSLKIYNAQP
mgnify:CR=1 FL=1